jgi:hypothetical protein
MDANPNRVAARDTDNFRREGVSGDDAASPTSEVAIPTNQLAPTLIQPSTLVDERYQPLATSHTFPSGYSNADVNSWQQNDVFTGPYDDHSPQVAESESSIGHALNRNLTVDRASYIEENHHIQGAVDWSGSDASQLAHLPPT